MPLSTLLLLGLRMAWIAYLQGGSSSECRILVSLYWVHITLIGLVSFLLRKERTWSGQVGQPTLTLFLDLCSSKVHCPAIPGPSFFSMSQASGQVGPCFSTMAFAWLSLLLRRLLGPWDHWHLCPGGSLCRTRCVLQLTSNHCLLGYGLVSSTNTQEWSTGPLEAFLNCT